MQLNLDVSIAVSYKSKSQKIRVMTESWVKETIFCVNCGDGLEQCKNNAPVEDFHCQKCSENYELKSKKNTLGKKIVDGAYSTMIERLQNSDNPNFFFLNYRDFRVNNFMVVPKHFFIPAHIEKRQALSASARRAGWTGCNILLHDIPTSGKIFYVKDGVVEDRRKVLEKWHKTMFLRNTGGGELKGWILDVMNCIDKLGKDTFSLDEIYHFEDILHSKHPNNSCIREKIRQQLQFLRDKGYVDFVSRGNYRLMQDN